MPANIINPKAAAPAPRLDLTEALVRADIGAPAILCYGLAASICFAEDA